MCIRDRPNIDEKMRLLQVDGAQVPVNSITDLKMYLDGLIITHKMRVSNLGAMILY